MSPVERESPYALALKIEQLRQIVPTVQPHRLESEFVSDFKERRIAHLVGSMQRCMSIAKVRIVVATVKNNPVLLKNAVAGVDQADLLSMIRYGIDPNRKVLMYFKKKFLESAPFHTVIFAIAHECAHLYLASRCSALAFDEPGVDICAMMMGFSLYYEKGSQYVPGWHPLFARLAPLCTKVGYLHEEDVRAVSAVLSKLRAIQVRT